MVHKLSPACTVNHVQITYNTSGTYHVQQVMCHVVQRASSSVKLERAEITFTLALFHWLKSLTNEGREETGVSRENAQQQASENAS